LYEWYKSYEELYHEGPAISEERLPLLLKLVDGLKFRNFLDVGCGDGSVTARFRERIGSEFTAGLEISEDGVTRAKRHGILAQIANIDADEFPFADETFDFILCSELIEHLFDPDHLLDEIHRVTKSQGLLLLTTPNVAAWYDRLSLLLGYQPVSIPVSLYFSEIGRLSGIKSLAGREHIRFFTARGIRDSLVNHGFEPIRIVGWMREPPPDAPFPFRQLARIVNVICSLRPSLCTTTIMLCRKSR
jgi:SAM-dependent methyltransferase